MIARRGLALLLLALAGAAPALADGCFPVARMDVAPSPGPIRLAATASPGLAASEGGLRLTYLGHSSFLIETPEAVTAVTDYNGYHRAPFAPTIATMNNAHSSHYSSSPEPEIAHALKGWNPLGGYATHDVTVRDLRVRNIPTAVHGRYGAQELSNSIFVFETAELCIAHLGHLHHLLTDGQVAELGRIDVLLVPIDGSFTIAQELIMDVIEQINPSVVVPMHYFGETVLSRFLALAAPRWAIVRTATPSIVLSRASLPHREVLVLPFMQGG